jgi:hypothetical protein
MEKTPSQEMQDPALGFQAVTMRSLGSRTGLATGALFRVQDTV